MSQLCLRSKQNIARAIKLQMDHKLRPRWHKKAGTTTLVCNLVHEHSGEWMHRGEGKNPEDSFHAAMQAFSAAPQAAQAESLGLENENLRSSSGIWSRSWKSRRMRRIRRHRSTIKTLLMQTGMMHLQ